jgi:zinc protease
LNEAGLVYFGALLNHTDSLDDARNALLEGLNDKDTVASLAGATLIRGTTKKNRQQIQDQIDRLKAQLNVGASATGEILKEAVLRKTEFEQIRRRRLTSLEFGKSEPQMVASTQIRRALYPFPKGDVRGTLSIEEQIEEVKAAKLEDATAFYKSFYGASHGELAVVGDFDPAEVKQAAAELFGNWKSAAKYERIKTGFQKTPVVSETIETPDKANAVFMAWLRLNLSDQDPDYPALVFGNYMLGGDFLNSRLATRIRVKDGLSYAVSSSVSASSDEKDGQFQALAIANPQNLAKVETAFKEELDRALKNGFTQTEMDADRDGWIQSRTVQRAEDRSLVNLLGTHDYDNRTLAWEKISRRRKGR